MRANTRIAFVFAFALRCVLVFRVGMCCCACACVKETKTLYLSPCEGGNGTKQGTKCVQKRSAAACNNNDRLSKECSLSWFANPLSGKGKHVGVEVTTANTNLPFQLRCNCSWVRLTALRNSVANTAFSPSNVAAFLCLAGILHYFISNCMQKCCMIKFYTLFQFNCSSFSFMFSIFTIYKLVYIGFLFMNNFFWHQKFIKIKLWYYLKF